MVIVIINIIIQKAVTVISISPYGTKEKVTKRNENLRLLVSKG